MIRIEILNAQEVLRQLAPIPGGVERAASRAIKRTLRGGRAEISRKVRERYTIKAGEILKSLRTKVSGLSGEITSTGRHIALHRFNIRPRKRPRKMPRGGVFAQVIKGGGGMLPHAFVMPQGQVAERVNKARLPVKTLQGPSAPQMVGNLNIAPQIQAKMGERLGINFAHEAAAVLGGFA